jgi:hypothetical protein
MIALLVPYADTVKWSVTLDEILTVFELVNFSKEANFLTLIL